MVEPDYMTNPEAILEFPFEHLSKIEAVVIATLLAQDLITAQGRINRVVNLLDPNNDGDFQLIQMLRGEQP